MSAFLLRDAGAAAAAIALVGNGDPLAAFADFPADQYQQSDPGDPAMSIYESVAFADLVTFARASAAWEVDSAGDLTSRAADVARKARDEASPYTVRGLLGEGAVSNGARNNPTTGAVLGVIGAGGAWPTNWSSTGTGFTIEIVAFGTRKGRPYIRVRFSTGASGTTLITVNCDTTTGGPAAAQNQLWTVSSGLSVFAAPTPPTSYRIFMQEMNAGGTGLLTNQSSTLTLTATPTRFDYSVALSQATTATVRAGYRISVTNGAPYDFTIDFELPQLEMMPYPTSPIVTAGAAVARAADLPTVPLVIDPTVGVTILAEWRVFGEATDSARDRHVLVADDGTANNKLELTARLAGTKNIRVRAVLAGVTVADLGLGAGPAAGVDGKVCLTMVNGYVGASFNGGAVASDTPVAVPALSVARLMHALAGDGNLNGALKVLKARRGAVDAAELIAISAGGPF